MYSIATIGWLGDAAGDVPPCPPGATCRNPIEFQRDNPPELTRAPSIDIPTLAIVGGVGLIVGGAIVFFLKR